MEKEKIDELLYDDVEAKFLELENRKKQRRRRRRKIRLITLALLVTFGVLYFSSSLSKVRSLRVSGNRFYTEEQVLKQASLSYDSRYLLHPSFLLRWKLEDMELVDSVDVDKTWDGSITITVKEKKIIGYYVKDDKNYVLLGNGESVELREENIDAIVYYPLIDGFDDEQLKNLAAAFTKKGEVVADDVIAMISEICPHAESYDANMARIVMQDGNTIYTSYPSVPLLNAYKSTLKNLKKDHVCFIMDAQTESYVTQDCKSFK